MEQVISQEQAVQMLDVAARQLSRSIYDLRQSYIDKALKTLDHKDVLTALQMEKVFLVLNEATEEQLKESMVTYMKEVLKELGTNPDGEKALSFMYDYHKLLKSNRS